jgi:hypothetical protein
MISTVAQAQTQRYQNRQLALISFNYTISKDIKTNFDEFAHLFPEVDHKKADRIIAVAKEFTWYILKERLESETGMYILPINSHGSSFKYDEYKFPNVNINKALKHGSTRYYLKVDLIISSGIPKGEMGYGAMPTDDAITEGMDLESACLPVMDMEISIYNDKGILPIQKISGSITASTPWVMSKDTFKGLINREEYKKDETDTLLGLTNVTIAKILRQF